MPVGIPSAAPLLIAASQLIEGLSLLGNSERAVQEAKRYRAESKSLEQPWNCGAPTGLR